MLDFIVLGLVPGTSLQITYGEVALLFIIGLAIMGIIYELRKNYSSLRALNKKTNLFSQRRQGSHSLRTA